MISVSYLYGMTKDRGIIIVGDAGVGRRPLSDIVASTRPTVSLPIRTMSGIAKMMARDMINEVVEKNRRRDIKKSGSHFRRSASERYS